MVRFAPQHVERVAGMIGLGDQAEPAKVNAATSRIETEVTSEPVVDSFSGRSEQRSADAGLSLALGPDAASSRFRMNSPAQSPEGPGPRSISSPPRGTDTAAMTTRWLTALRATPTGPDSSPSSASSPAVQEPIQVAFYRAAS